MDYVTRPSVLARHDLLLALGEATPKWKRLAGGESGRALAASPCLPSEGLKAEGGDTAAFPLEFITLCKDGK